MTLFSLMLKKWLTQNLHWANTEWLFALHIFFSKTRQQLQTNLCTSLLIKLGRVPSTNYFMPIHRLRCSIQLIGKLDQKNHWKNTLYQSMWDFCCQVTASDWELSVLIVYSILSITIVNSLLKKHQKLQCKCWHHTSANKKLRSPKSLTEATLAGAGWSPFKYGRFMHKANCGLQLWS